MRHLLCMLSLASLRATEAFLPYTAGYVLLLLGSSFELTLFVTGCGLVHVVSLCVSSMSCISDTIVFQY